MIVAHKNPEIAFSNHYHLRSEIILLHFPFSFDKDGSKLGHTGDGFIDINKIGFSQMLRYCETLFSLQVSTWVNHLLGNCVTTRDIEVLVDEG